VIVELEADGELDGVRLVAVVTGTNPEAPNYPPARWLEREGWPGEVILDDDEHAAAGAYGLAGYPFIVTLDPDGDVVSRTSGEIPREALIAAADAARASGS
ncbi:MAG: hypothetical protein M3Z03_16365, partial [Actinomycetota bacterium]|nr:hypothetical protein [Actinomycetota bacterium]